MYPYHNNQYPGYDHVDSRLYQYEPLRQPPPPLQHPPLPHAQYYHVPPLRQPSRRRAPTSHRSYVGEPGYPAPADMCNAKAPFTPKDDEKLKNLKQRTDPALTWKQISDFFPGRSANTLQVHYCTKIKLMDVKWTPDLDKQLRAALEEDDANRPKRIARALGGAVSAADCEERLRTMQIRSGSSSNHPTTSSSIVDADEHSMRNGIASSSSTATESPRQRPRKAAKTQSSGGEEEEEEDDEDKEDVKEESDARQGAMPPSDLAPSASRTHSIITADRRRTSEERHHHPNQRNRSRPHPSSTFWETI